MSEQAWLEPLLLSKSTDHYFIEHKKKFANHISQGMTAMARLGADADAVLQHANWYESRLEPASQHKPDEPPPVYQSLSELPLGQYKYIQFYAIRDYFDGVIDRHHGNYRDAVRELFPQISDGLAAALLHGVIQLGYGLAADCRKNVAEGLAYLCLAYQSAYEGDEETNKNRSIGQFGQGSQNPLDVLEKVRGDAALQEKMQQAIKCAVKHGYTYESIMTTIVALFRYCSKSMQEYADMLQAPDIERDSGVTVRALTTWLVDVTMTVYTRTPKLNDFYLLHGVTGAWSLKQVLELFEGDSGARHEVGRAVRTFVMSLLAVYLGRQAPKLQAPAPLQEAVDDAFWQRVNEQMLSVRTRDSHHYKLVQVAYDMWKENPSNGDLYGLAAKQCLDNELFFHD